MDGKPLKEHLQSIHRQTGVMPRQLAEAVPMPSGCGLLWRDFVELHRTRGRVGHTAAPAPISYQDIDAMQRVRGIDLQAWEVDAIRAADAAYFEHIAEGGK